jgi:hypothetical protein
MDKSKFHLIAIFCVLYSFNILAQTGYKIDVQIKPYQNQWIYLAYYYGGIKGLADSA